MQILELRTKWESEESKCHFESGTFGGYGAINLVLSHLPGRVLRLLELIGFSGNRTTGRTYLMKSAENFDGMRSFVSQLFIVGYECYMEQIFGLGRGDLSRVDRITERGTETHPEVLKT